MKPYGSSENRYWVRFLSLSQEAVIKLLDHVILWEHVWETGSS